MQQSLGGRLQTAKQRRGKNCHLSPLGTKHLFGLVWFWKDERVCGLRAMNIFLKIFFLFSFRPSEVGIFYSDSAIALLVTLKNGARRVLYLWLGEKVGRKKQN